MEWIRLSALGLLLLAVTASAEPVSRTKLDEKIEGDVSWLMRLTGSVGGALFMKVRFRSQTTFTDIARAEEVAHP